MNTRFEAEIRHGAHVEVRCRSEHSVAGLRLSGEKKRVREGDERGVEGLGVGEAGGARVAVRGAEGMEEVEALEEKSGVVEEGEVVCCTAAHDAGTDHYHIEVHFGLLVWLVLACPALPCPALPCPSSLALAPGTGFLSKPRLACRSLGTAVSCFI
jgi:hypothetical protein